MCNWKSYRNIPNIQFKFFFIKNYILDIDSNGCRKDHSPQTAILNLYNTLHQNLEADMKTALLTTDLSSAYNTVDSQILLNKLEYYGVRGSENKLIESILTNRRQFVKLDLISSILRKSPKYGVYKVIRYLDSFSIALPMKYHHYIN